MEAGISDQTQKQNKDSDTPKRKYYTGGGLGNLVMDGLLKATREIAEKAKMPDWKEQTKQPEETSKRPKDTSLFEKAVSSLRNAKVDWRKPQKNL
ncbi:MAG TPA: hypothetical protein VMT62_11370 [Syntrophorhabdaceae bacterium]|nr:hypothetical protein [Syntrophorhabdaceae bacterium]